MSTEPLDLDAIERSHYPSEVVFAEGHPECAGCGFEYPCQTTQLVAELRAARGRITDLEAALALERQNHGAADSQLVCAIDSLEAAEASLDAVRALIHEFDEYGLLDVNRLKRDILAALGGSGTVDREPEHTDDEIEVQFPPKRGDEWIERAFDAMLDALDEAGIAEGGHGSLRTGRFSIVLIRAAGDPETTP